MNQYAADYAWFTIHPVGTAFSPSSSGGLGGYGWNAHGCCPCHELGIDDFAFSDALLDWVAAHLCVNMSQVFSTGYSNGGFMTYALGCERADRFAGIAVNAGSIARSSMRRCAAAPALPVISFHSLDDPTVNYNGTWLEASQAEIDDMHRARAGCTGSEKSVITFDSSTTICRRVVCTNQQGKTTPVETCTLVGLDHCWVGGRSGGFNALGNCHRRATDIDATLRMFQFWSESGHVTNPAWLAA